MEEQKSLKNNTSFQSDISTGMVEISLSNESLDLPRVIYEEKEPSPTKPTPKAEMTLKPVENFDPKLVPLILRHLGAAELFRCCRVSWQWFKIAASILYQNVQFAQLSGSRLKLFQKTIQRSILSPKGSRETTIDYISHVQYLTITNIVFDEDTQLQPWSLVRDIIGLCSPTLCGISLEIGDDSFADLPQDFVYLLSNITIPNLRILRVSSKCMRMPSRLVLELLRASPTGGLSSIRFPRCLTNFDASGWFLICEKGGESLEELVLTPAMGPNMLGWDEHMFVQGLEQIAMNCHSLKRIDLSGHALSLPQKVLENFLKFASDITEFYMPCELNDSHLMLFMSNKPWQNIKTLGFSCSCIDGEIRERQPNGMSCNRFVDSVLIAFLDYCVSKIDHSFSIYLPVFILTVKTGKRIETMTWLSELITITQRNGDYFTYKEKIILSVPTRRLYQFI
ncbi:hypothetical protein HK103_000691 [Boothiomyces macroporosus]|uniref:F-box domain-containing protein n=1 Tax=Boothiomyces macroporosus TaxID=261099 RepID=A0AAD5UBM5_9FUNG|nr:hypothetical protein HK103_000691 [Boothiomyces macroporosus]